ncbi:MAG TPA: SDR family oxidoreductase [Solirubrobacteraceae bacterium]|nr:SDR family oxidoreductase [Solirubrobacteraceae bacterium]
MTDPIRLQGVHVAITGGARGIGAATAERLRRDGARITLGDIDVTAVEATAARLGAVGLALDVTDRESFTAFLDAAEAAQGPVDVLINNAGIMPIGPFLEEPDDVAHRQFEINVHGVILGMKIALPRMLARGSGHVVNLASAAGRIALPGEATYVATKHAVVGLSESVRCELEGTGVGVTTVLPNLANTRLGSGMHAARGMHKLEAADVADAIVDGLRRRRPEVYVPASLRPLSVLEIALPRPIKRVVHRAFGSDQIAQQFDHAERAAYQEATGRPLRSRR